MAQPPKSEDASSDEINESSPTSSTPAPAEPADAPADAPAETPAASQTAPEVAAASEDAAAQGDSAPSDAPDEAAPAVASSPAPIEDAVHPDAPDASTLPSSFVEMGLPAPMLAALEKLGWGAPTKVQAAAFGPASAGKDVLVQSQTGSGKTGAFCLPWLAGRFEDKDAAETGVQLLVMTPTRELAKQVCDQLVGLAGETPLTPLPVYGGTPIGPQFDALKRGVHAVVGTPGRILDHIRRRTLDLSKVQTAILDEADEMLSMGFLEDIHAILDACQKDRQTMLFSATVPSDIERIARRYMKNPESLKLSGDDIAASLIDHTYYSVPGSMRTRDLMNFIAQEEPGSTLIFCNTREETNLVANVLRKEGFSAEAISSDLSQAAREHVLGAMRKGRLRFLVATDVASRGIDITHISHVVNYSFPQNAESYVHRTGRTGRAGRAGKAVSLIGPQDMGNFYYLKLAYPSIEFTESKLPPAEELDARRNQTKLDQISKRFPDLVSADWRLLVRTLSSDPRGEQVMAYLLSEAMSSPDPATQVARDLPEEEDDEYAGGRGRRPSGRRDRESERPRSRDRDGERPRSRDRDAERSGRGERSGDGERSGRGGRDRGRRPRHGRDEDGATASEATSDEARRRRNRQPRPEQDAASTGVVIEATGPDDTVELETPASAGSEPAATAETGTTDPALETAGTPAAEVSTEAAGTSPGDEKPASEGEGRGRRRRRGRRRGGRDGAPRADGVGGEGSEAAGADGTRDEEDSSPEQESGPTEPAPAPELAAAASDPEGDTEVATEALPEGEPAEGETAAELTAAPSEATEGLQETDEGVSARGRRRRRRRRRRGRGKGDEGGQEAGGDDGEAGAADAGASQGVSADAEGGSEDDGSGKRRRRRRRGGRGKRPESETETETETEPVQQHVSQDQIIIDIDENELEVVRDEFGEIDELDDLTLKGRRRGVIDALQDEVELEDMSDEDTPAADSAADAEASEDGDDAAEDGDEVAADGESSDDVDDKEAKKRKRRRRRRKKKPAEDLVAPELTAPPHKDFWEVWSTKFTFREFEDDQFRGGTEAIVDEPDPEPESAADTAGEPRRKRRSRRGGSDRNRGERSGNDRAGSERPPRTVVNGSGSTRAPASLGADDGPMVTVALNVGRTHGKKSAHVRELLASDFGLEGRSVRNLTVKETLTEFRVSTTAFESLKAAVLGYVFDDIELELTVVEAAELETAPAATESEAGTDTSEPVPPAAEAASEPVAAAETEDAVPDAAVLASAPEGDSKPPQPEV